MSLYCIALPRANNDGGKMTALEPQRPNTALYLHDVKVGDRIVAYAPDGSDRVEVEIVGFQEVIERGEVATFVTYRTLDDQRTNTNEACALGLAPTNDGSWSKYAIPFDEE